MKFINGQTHRTTGTKSKALVDLDSTYKLHCPLSGIATSLIYILLIDLYCQ